MAIETCFECQNAVEEDQGRWLILDETKSEGFDWKFMCVQCVRAWRKRGLEQEGISDEAVMVQLDKEYPLN